VRLGVKAEALNNRNNRRNNYLIVMDREAYAPILPTRLAQKLLSPSPQGLFELED
jgi:hypothetical protein